MWKATKEGLAGVSLGLLCGYLLLLLPIVNKDINVVLLGMINQGIVMAYILCLVLASKEVIDITERYVGKILNIITSFASIWGKKKNDE